jgi:hypothetical protein
MITRVLFGIFLIISAFIFPWWISIILACIGMFKFKNLYEVIVVGIIIDSMYGLNLSIFGFEFVFSLILIISFYLISILKDRVLM